MCINCNIPLPVAMDIIVKYDLPFGCIMTNRELANICNPLIRGGGLAALMSGDVPDNYFDKGLDDINYTTLQNYDWILEKIEDTKWGKIRCGKIVKKDVCEEELQNEKKTSIEILDEICKVWYKDI
jgi:hypothetical protein